MKKFKILSMITLGCGALLLTGCGERDYGITCEKDIENAHLKVSYDFNEDNDQIENIRYFAERDVSGKSASEIEEIRYDLYSEYCKNFDSSYDLITSYWAAGDWSYKCSESNDGVLVCSEGGTASRTYGKEDGEELSYRCSVEQENEKVTLKMLGDSVVLKKAGVDIADADGKIQLDDLENKMEKDGFSCRRY